MTEFSEKNGIPFTGRLIMERQGADAIEERAVLNGVVQDCIEKSLRQTLSNNQKRIMELLDDPNPGGETIEELAKLMGQDK